MPTPLSRRNASLSWSRSRSGVPCCSGEYDAREALITIRSEAGGVDAADFAEMLLRMYLRWSERHGYKAEVYDTSYTRGSGSSRPPSRSPLRTPTARSRSSSGFAGGRRIGPFDNQAAADLVAGVEVLPVVEEADRIDIPENDIQVDVFRSTAGWAERQRRGLGRADHPPAHRHRRHLPQNEKSQLQNKVSAMRMQPNCWSVRATSGRPARRAKGDGGSSWGNQMRSYVLHPYQMVKDLRTEYETGNPTAVFDGDIDEFLESGIRWRRQMEKTPN